MKTLMRTVETVDRKTRNGPREERARAFVWDRSADHIRASGQTAAHKGRIHDRIRRALQHVPVQLESHLRRPALIVARLGQQHRQQRDELDRGKNAEGDGGRRSWAHQLTRVHDGLGLLDQ
jgi:hypothetical protein